jgi:hypothetical protein
VPRRYSVRVNNGDSEDQELPRHESQDGLDASREDDGKSGAGGRPEDRSLAERQEPESDSPWCSAPAPKFRLHARQQLRRQGTSQAIADVHRRCSSPMFAAALPEYTPLTCLFGSLKCCESFASALGEWLKYAANSYSRYSLFISSTSMYS